MSLVVLVVLVFAVILAVLARQAKSEGWNWKPGYNSNDKFQLNTILYLMVAVIFGIPIVAQIYTSVILTDPLSILVGFYGVFAAIFGTETLIDYGATKTLSAPGDESS